jgi:hypothetical protein
MTITARLGYKMGDTSIAQDILNGVTDALADLGDTRILRIFTEGALDPNDPGAGVPLTPENFSVEALLYEYEDSYIDDKVILMGDRKAILSIDPLTSGQISGIKQGAKLIDGSDVWTVVSTERIEVAGIIVTIILQIRGA